MQWTQAIAWLVSISVLLEKSVTSTDVIQSIANRPHRGIQNYNSSYKKQQRKRNDNLIVHNPLALKRIRYEKRHLKHRAMKQTIRLSRGQPHHTKNRPKTYSLMDFTSAHHSTPQNGVLSSTREDQQPQPKNRCQSSRIRYDKARLSCSYCKKHIGDHLCSCYVKNVERINEKLKPNEPLKFVEDERTNSSLLTPDEIESDDLNDQSDLEGEASKIVSKPRKFLVSNMTRAMLEFLCPHCGREISISRAKNRKLLSRGEDVITVSKKQAGKHTIDEVSHSKDRRWLKHKGMEYKPKTNQ